MAMSSEDIPASMTAEQQEVVGRPAGARLLVLAGAGTGKTHVLAARLSALVERDGLMPGGEVLVLSFSRAAVMEARRRVADTWSASYVAVTTFDAFATGLLNSCDPEGAWKNKGYDGRIAAAIEQLSCNPNAEASVRQYRHILIDEIQDLVGIRASFVVMLLGTAQCGFTLLGDPAQGIYEYQASAATGEMTSADLLARLRAIYKDSLVELALCGNFRAQSPEAVQAADLGTRLRDVLPDFASIRSDIDSFLLGRTYVRGLSILAPSLRLADSPSTALLCRTNAEAMLVARRLRHLGVDHFLQRAGTDRVAPPWLARLLDGTCGSRIRRAKFLEQWKAIGQEYDLDGATCWCLLKGLDSRRGDELDLRKVARALQVGEIPQGLNFVPRARVVVSTIHRAKGLEFDRVVITEARPGDASDESLGAETRLLYVAVTRARKDVLVMEAPNTAGCCRCASLSDRWIRRNYGGHGAPISAIEIRGEDAEAGKEAWGGGVDPTATAERQKYIDANVQPGDPLVLVLADSQMNERAEPAYEIRHGGRTVGVTASCFVGDMQCALRTKARDRLPRRITEIYVECVCTTVKDAPLDFGPATVAGSAGLTVRPIGLGELSYTEGAG